MIHRKERVVITVIDILDELGIQGLSTREIARRQGISEGTLFRHFKNKNEIILAVLEHFSKFDRDIIQSIKLMQLMPRKAITYFINAYSEYYENYPAITSVTQVLDELARDSELGGKVKSIFNCRRDFIRDMVVEGQRVKEFRGDFDSESLADVISGISTSICFRWRMCGLGFPLKERILSTLDMILDSFSK